MGKFTMWGLDKARYDEKGGEHMDSAHAPMYR
jgi:hypothetical protein